MMKFLFALLLSLLLCGCSAQNPDPVTPTSVPAMTAVQNAEPVSQDTVFMESFEKTEAASGFSLADSVSGILPLGEHLLFFSGNENTTLILVDSATGKEIARHEAGLFLTPENAAVRLLENGLSYFHGTAGEIVMLSDSLREVKRIKAPEDLMGMPLLSGDAETVYYCTASSVRALDIRSGISRILKEAAYPEQSISGLLLQDTVLQISITDTDGSRRTLFLSGENGQLLQEAQGNILPMVTDHHYLLQTGSTILCGRIGENTLLLQPRLTADDCYLLGQQAVTSGWQDDKLLLEEYDLDSGFRTASFSLPTGQSPQNLICDADGSIWLLCHRENGEQVLYQWDPAFTPAADNAIYTAAYFTREDPDYEGLAACKLYAEELSEKHGIEILIYKDAVELEPWDYHLDYEYQSSVLQRELALLDHRLSLFPEGFLQTLTDKFTALKICIVRSAVGSPESGSLEDVNGIQFMDDFDAYIILSTAHDTEYALYHELSHLIETVVLTESVAYDRWENLNPSDFQYDNDYISNEARDGGSWMKPGKEYFIDTYSMSYPKEDRARLFEYAMTSGHEELFRSVNLQAKLKQLCTGIREGFGLTASAETFPWEQYLTP